MKVKGRQHKWSKPILVRLAPGDIVETQTCDVCGVTRRVVNLKPESHKGCCLGQPSLEQRERIA